MEKLVTSNLKLGIISGGQLGKMLIQEASKWGISSYILDNDEACSARGVASHYVKGSNLNFDAVYEFGQLVDVLTFELENINIEALKKLESEGKKIAPSAQILELIQDKGLQKEFYSKNNIPTSKFEIYPSKSAVLTAIEDGSIQFPFVQKLRKGGYDGKGVAVISEASHVDKLLDGACVIEEKVAIEKELSVVVARNQHGEVRCYPVVEMLFDPEANLVDKLICPSVISAEQSEKALEFASKIIELLDMQGLLAVEFFLDTKGAVIVNEMAPRPHNSGHHSFETIITSQFEQHLRAVLNLPLGSTEIKMPSVMINLVGAQGHEGPVSYEGLVESMAIEGVKIHIYGKKITKPYRKMGHVTIMSSSIEDALEKAEVVKQLIKVKSCKKN